MAKRDAIRILYCDYVNSKRIQSETEEDYIKACCKLRETFTEEQKKMYNTVEDLEGMYISEEAERSYIEGFQTAMSLFGVK